MNSSEAAFRNYTQLPQRVPQAAWLALRVGFGGTTFCWDAASSASCSASVLPCNSGLIVSFEWSSVSA